MIVVSEKEKVNVQTNIEYNFFKYGNKAHLLSKYLNGTLNVREGSDLK